MHVQIILDLVKVAEWLRFGFSYLLGKSCLLGSLYILFVLSCLFVILVNSHF